MGKRFVLPAQGDVIVNEPTVFFERDRNGVFPGPKRARGNLDDLRQRVSSHLSRSKRNFMPRIRRVSLTGKFRVVDESGNFRLDSGQVGDVSQQQIR